jgi:hypothetical protein
MNARLLSAMVGLTLGLSQAHAQTRPQVVEYKGLCEASAGSFVDSDHFVVASDETNKLQLYRRGNPAPIGAGFDMEPFTSFDKSDLEAVALVGERIYWMSSHSFNKDKEDKKKRKIFFATRSTMQDGKPVLASVGKPIIATLRDPLIAAIGVQASELNIEGMAATPADGLLIGLRGPLSAKKEALLVAFRNPAAVVDNGAAPQFDRVDPLDLEGRGIRSIDLISRDPERYLIIAGPVVDADSGFAVFSWDGPGKKPTKLDVAIGNIKPEAAMAVPGQKIVQLLSDDDDDCEQPEKRRFRSVDIKVD